AVERDDTRFALQQQVIRLPIAMRSIGPVARDGTAHESRVACTDRRVTEAGTIGGARTLVVHEHVSSLEQSIECTTITSVLQIESDAAFAAIEPHKIRTQPVHR